MRAAIDRVTRLPSVSAPPGVVNRRRRLENHLPSARIPRGTLPALPVIGAALPMLLACVVACAPIVRPAPFQGARNQVTDTSLIGPFDGQIVDATTGEPVQDAVVVGVWSYDQGDGFIGPSGSETISVQTDDVGRYRIARAPLRVRGPSLRLVSFHLVVYKRGYAGYRSDTEFEGATSDFTGRHNRIELTKWRERDSHAEHLLFLAPPREVARVADWEQSQANLDLYRALSGAVAVPGGEGDDEGDTGEGETGETGEVGPDEHEGQWLDAAGLIGPEEIAMRTGYDGEFELEDLTDFPRTPFYHGVLVRAVDRDESHDFSFRVWHRPPGGLDPIITLFRENLPVEATGEVTDETWIYIEPDTEYRGVAFIDRSRETGVLISCGPQQCADVDTAIILAKFIQDRLDALTWFDAPAETTPPDPADAEAKPEETEP